MEAQSSTTNGDSDDSSDREEMARQQQIGRSLKELLLLLESEWGKLEEIERRTRIIELYRNKNFNYDWEEDVNVSASTVASDETQTPTGLSYERFSGICRSIFSNDQDLIYPVDLDYAKTLFNIFDLDGNGMLEGDEIYVFHQTWMKKLLRPVSCLVIVDVQNDFISGSLALINSPAKQDGLEVIDPINKMIEAVNFKNLYYSMDWHPADHISFADNVHLRKLDETSLIVDADLAKEFDTVVFAGPPSQEQKLWPRHCVQNSQGAQLHDELQKNWITGKKIYKGTNPEVDSYSALFDNNKKSFTELVRLLEEAGITDVYVCGLAYDFCVGSTAMDAISLGYKTILVEDATRGITLEGINATRQKLLDSHALVVNSSEIPAMVDGKDIRPEFGIKLALDFHNKRLRKLREEGGVYPDPVFGDPESFKLPRRQN